jgi:DNA damage-binding protein 1
VGEYSIIYHNGTSFCSLAIHPTIIKCHALIDANGERILLGDHLGRLYVLVLENDKKRVTRLRLEDVGETSCASALAYLQAGMVFVGSTFGDSQLVRLRAEVEPVTGSHLDVLATYGNLGPIVDFCVVDLDRQGQVSSCFIRLFFVIFILVISFTSCVLIWHSVLTLSAKW